MALFLYRLGQTAFRHRRLVLGLWVLILVGASLAAATLKGPTSTSFSIPGTEAQQAIDTLQARFPAANATGASARVVFAAPEGGSLTDPANAAKVGDVLAALRAAPKVGVRERPVQDRHRQPRRAGGAGAGGLHRARHRDDRCRPRGTAGGGGRRPRVGAHGRGRRARRSRPSRSRAHPRRSASRSRRSSCSSRSGPSSPPACPC